VLHTFRVNQLFSSRRLFYDAKLSSHRGQLSPDNHSEPQTLADAIESNIPRLINLWLNLGENGPLGVVGDPGDLAFLRPRYLTPLARLMVGALRGSANHRAVYLDERTRYLPADLDAGSRAALLEHQLEIEITEFAATFSSEQLSPETVAHEFDVLHSGLKRRPGKNRTKLLLVGDCIFVETRAFLQQQARDQSIDLDIDHVFFSASQGALSVDDVLASIKRAPPDLIGMSLFSFEGIPPYVGLLRQAAHLATPELDARVQGLVDLLDNVIQTIRAETDAPILLHNACGLPLDRVRRRLPFLAPLSRSRRKVVELIAAKTADLAATRENTLLVDEVGLAENSGGLRACGRGVFRADDVPAAVFHTSRLGSLLADHYFEVLAAYRMLRNAKVLLVDLDNTLWFGVMAEGPVQHNLELQKLLKRLKEAGVLLVALSKNDPESIRWSEMALAPDDFVLHKISWQPKPDGVSQAVSELDLAPAAFVLLDDNPVERALVSEQIPGVAALDPARRETWRALEMWLDFPSTKQTEEARRRTELYREAAERRRSTAGVHDYPSMMQSLGLRLGLRPAQQSDMDRLLELIQRTNQFNTTTKRRSTAEIQQLFRSASHQIYVASLRDRFGSLGVVAVGITERTPDDEVIIDSIIMSCRAMGFGLEQALLSKLIDREPAKRHIGLFIPTERNGPAAGLFANCGFHKIGDDNRWVLENKDQRPEVPAWFNEER
jgi:FkbH-like protein